jgi:hypothetical protein
MCGPSQPLIQAPTHDTQGQAMGTHIIPHKKNDMRVQEETYKKTHTLAYTNKNWQKRHINKTRKKERKNICFKHKPYIDLNFNPNFNIPKIKL